MLIILKYTGKQIPDKQYYSLIKATQIPLLNGSVIFINNYHRFYTMVFVKHFGEHHQGKHIVFSISSTLDDSLIKIIVRVIVRIKLCMTFVFHTDQQCYHIVCFFPCLALDIFEGEENHRELTLLIAVFFSASPDFSVHKIL